MAMTAAEKQRAYRARNKGGNAPVTQDGNGNAPNVTVTRSATAMPALPDDDVIACNADVGWPDVLAMTKSQVDYVYRTWQAVGDSILLRLRRAAGYHRRAV